MGHPRIFTFAISAVTALAAHRSIVHRRLRIRSAARTAPMLIGTAPSGFRGDSAVARCLHVEPFGPEHSALSWCTTLTGHEPARVG